MLQNKSFFAAADTPYPELIRQNDYAWEALNNLKEYMLSFPKKQIFTELGKKCKPLERTLVIYNEEIIDGDDCTILLGKTTSGEMQVFQGDELLAGASVLLAGSCFIGDRFSFGKGVLVESGATIKSPAFLGDYNEVRQGAYLRGYTLTGQGCVLGHATEVKHAIFLNDAKAGHFNYIGDSILGNNTNLGAGTKLANLRFVEGNLFITSEGKQIDTGRRKLGAILGDNTQTGCNSVTNPGALLGKNSFVMPNATVRSGYHEAGSVIR